ncbi:Crp/Fnr family transcriptional regulator [Qipengyuania sp. S6317L1]|uniref:Crp/Fnr family transcriptional regulator n=1 Tax=Qipengyuania sp. S6317L1 TaxID=2926410 RepID=UPI001FF3DEA5|nr:Crp/Fnr family transcriptional regulator [Qipengyuania sp. S6317L1]MCK0098579.1 Crp/Fnr family transcriptional regulator [Qipengyuania sp. S6317L1]
MPEPAIVDEITTYPKTGRFLLGRLRHDLSDEEKRILEDSIDEVEVVTEPRRILERGATCGHSTMLIDGFILRTLDGPEQRYGVSFHVPGDFVDLHCFALKRLDHNIDTVGEVRLGYVPHTRLIEIMEEQPHLARVFWFATLLDAAMHREWVMKLEQLTTARRLAHIFAEIWTRLQMVGLGDAQGFDTPLTQGHLAEMSGATAIHVNRAIRALREQGIVDVQRGRINIADKSELEKFGRFTPDYLYGEGELSLREGFY